MIKLGPWKVLGKITEKLKENHSLYPLMVKWKKQPAQKWLSTITNITFPFKTIQLGGITTIKLFKGENPNKLAK